jgi:antagonist of KipI
MSLRIIRAGILDTIQDQGRYGFQHLGINPNGAMDRFSASLANALLGKELHLPIVEMHYPGPQIKFDEPAIICITGADFSPSINGHSIPMHHPVTVNKGAVLKYEKRISGARSYLSLLQDFKIDEWMNSYSTNLKAVAGGWEGRTLTKGDVLNYEKNINISKFLQGRDCVVLPWKANDTVKTRTEIQFIIGSEWNWLTTEARETFQTSLFQISNDADRMGFRLMGNQLEVESSEQLVSSAVSFGTIQLLPNGKLIILMADHQTTGGYPRVAHIISAHLPIVAQKNINDILEFRLTDLYTAEQKLLNQQKYLHQLQIACKFRMENVLHASLRY